MQEVNFSDSHTCAMARAFPQTYTAHSQKVNKRELKKIRIMLELAEQRAICVPLLFTNVWLFCCRETIYIF